MDWNNKYQEIYGDLIELAKSGEFDAIIHGCNCFSNMGAGIAKQIKSSFKDIDKVDINAVPGNISYKYYFDSDCIVYNAYTQIYPGKPNNKKLKWFSQKNKIFKDNEEARYEYMRQAFSKIAETSHNLYIGLPLIGCGLAGLNWDKVKSIIQEEFRESKIIIVKYINN